MSFVSNILSLVLFISRVQLKTTSVHALARQLLGSAYSNGVLELNASDSRGIDVSIYFYIFTAFVTFNILSRRICVCTHFLL
jgi:hypothetical protein